MQQPPAGDGAIYLPYSLQTNSAVSMTLENEGAAEGVEGLDISQSEQTHLQLNK